MAEHNEKTRIDAPSVAWKSGEPIPESEYIRLSPTLIRPDPILGNIRRARDTARQEDLNATIAEEGLLQPIAVRFLGEEVVPVPVLVWGSRRLEAILATGIEEIVVRNLGRLSDRDALLFQFLENDQHVALHPVDDALATARLVQMFAGSQTEVARRTRRSEAMVSILRRTGDALQLLRPEELEEVYTAEGISKRAFSDLVAQARSPENLARRLLDLARSRDPRPPGRPRGRKAGPAFQAIPNDRGGGERFSVRWRDADLARDPAMFVQSLADFLIERLEKVAERAERMREGRHPPRRQRSGRPNAEDKPARRPTPRPRAWEDESLEETPISAADLARFDELLAAADARIAAVRERFQQHLEEEKGRRRKGFNG